jgi:AraC-like DNA-binding protein
VASDAFERWRNVYMSAALPMEFASNDRCRDCCGRCNDIGSPLNGGLTVGALGSLQLHQVTGGSADVHRTRSTIRMSDPSLIKVGVQIRGNGLLVQHDREAALTPGDFVIYETSQPYAWRFENHFTTFFLMIPRDRLRLPSSVKTFAAVPIRGGDGMGALVSPLLSNLRRQGLSKAALSVPPLFEDAVLDLISATLSGYTTRISTVPGVAILHSAMAFIEAHLADPGLDTSMVAAAHHISVRYLQMLFKAERLTVAGWIRRCRLERCRRDLLDHRLTRENISTICARHGLVDQAQFSRLFKASYGVSPREFRQQHRESAKASADAQFRTSEGIPLPEPD